ncbi:hypothetical protein IMG5_077360 [Ichthyophthirius multifiliis]|uniref:Uncharacterized protein n=1 Tax=Ichthyophthirius multifiliis TaxID=5932 RepID=G0QQD5_ICHMU|nr:hypothetical protein IMG5_077360 [Ichthyophthirius multifiliis]EGR32570.1 hypothetical protein IMG5_077360 [Ichthyophthirius multifiliis]|eukprot:XP_004036556.1 hypothetical protein IMG5_077360 [Ichthyophthirius multifiliis]
MLRNMMANLFANYQNMHKIIENTEGSIYLGDYTAALDVKTLKENNIKTKYKEKNALNYQSQ